MDSFENNLVYNDLAVDPAAEFIAREQNALAELQDDNLDLQSYSQENFGKSHVETSGSFEMINTFSEQQDQNNVTRVEAEKIKKWREIQQDILQKKDENEEKKKVELRQEAKNELEDWYRQHEDSISKTKAANRNAEKQFVSEKNEIEPGTEWERIAKLCDFNPKTSKSNKDISRMRSIILQLKQTPQGAAKSSA